jgi:hypothetical protein
LIAKDEVVCQVVGRNPLFADGNGHGGCTAEESSEGFETTIKERARHFFAVEKRKMDITW